ncbi:MAG: integrase [Oligoflexales bacterium]|nr:integrase [Oligoflexales bacterium]
MKGICSKRMVAALPLWLEYYNPPDMDDQTRTLLLSISASSIDRLLSPYRKRVRKGLSSTKSGAFVKTQIPIELIDGHIRQPGYIEADTVAHCGESLMGDFANTLTMTDLFSGWTENRAAWTKTAEIILEKIKEVRDQLPFYIKGFACDNGSEFINESLLKYFKSQTGREVSFTRRRPYKKNDAAHVEQKNDTHVRQIFGYERLDHKQFVNMMNEIYVYYWNPLNNFFMPALKLKKKVRIGGKIRKFHDKPLTPYQRLLDSGMLTDEQKSSLELTKSLLNPIELKEGLDKKLAKFFEMVHRHRNLFYEGLKDNAA